MSEISGKTGFIYKYAIKTELAGSYTKLQYLLERAELQNVFSSD